MKTAYAKAKYIRISPVKVRRIAHQIVNKPVIDAESYLVTMTNKGALVLKKAIHSARTNYMRQNQNADETNLFVSKILVDSCATFKRFRPIGRGRSAGILKRNCQVFVEVAERELEAKPAAVKKEVTAKDEPVKAVKENTKKTKADKEGDK